VKVLHQPSVPAQITGCQKGLYAHLMIHSGAGGLIGPLVDHETRVVGRGCVCPAGRRVAAGSTPVANSLKTGANCLSVALRDSFVQIDLWARSTTSLDAVSRPRRQHIGGVTEVCVIGVRILTLHP
jgi:hypothetical protein